MAVNPDDLLAIAAEDEALKRRVLKLANAALKQAEFMLEHGDRQAKMMVTNKFLAIFAKAMDSKQVDEEMDELKKAVAALSEAIMGGGDLTVAEGPSGD